MQKQKRPVFRNWLRNLLARWSKALGASESPQEAYQRRKLEIYRTLAGTTVGEGLALLNEVTMEMVAPSANIQTVQRYAPEITKVGGAMKFPDFMYLLASAMNFTINSSLGEVLPQIKNLTGN